MPLSFRVFGRGARAVDCPSCPVERCDLPAPPPVAQRELTKDRKEQIKTTEADKAIARHSRRAIEATRNHQVALEIRQQAVQERQQAAREVKAHLAKAKGAVPPAGGVGGSKALPNRQPLPLSSIRSAAEVSAMHTQPSSSSPRLSAIRSQASAPEAEPARGAEPEGPRGDSATAAAAATEPLEGGVPKTPPAAAAGPAPGDPELPPEVAALPHLLHSVSLGAAHPTSAPPGAQRERARSRPSEPTKPGTGSASGPAPLLVPGLEGRTSMLGGWETSPGMGPQESHLLVKEISLGSRLSPRKSRPAPVQAPVKAARSSGAINILRADSEGVRGSR